jgi:PAS domain S-box-containing protein
MARQSDPDLVLMDIKLSGEMDGIEAAEQIHRLHNIPVVFLTAHSDDRTLQRAKVSDPYGYMVKPFSEAELRTTIEVSLHNHHRRKRAQETSRWFSRASDMIDGAVVLCDERGNLLHMNSLAEAITGWHQDDATGRPISEILVLKDPGADRPIDRFSVSISSEDSERTSLECILVSRDRSEIPIEIDFIPVIDRNGNLDSVLFLFREDTKNFPKDQDGFGHAANLTLAAELSRADGEHLIAERFYQRALDLMTKDLGPDDPKVGKLLQALTAIYRALGKNVDAQIASCKAERIRSGQLFERWLSYRHSTINSSAMRQ